jgi:hypothetical protein
MQAARGFLLIVDALGELLICQRTVVKTVFIVHTRPSHFSSLYISEMLTN